MTKFSVSQLVCGLTFVCVGAAGIAFADLSPGQCHADIYLDSWWPPAPSIYSFYCKSIDCPDVPDCEEPREVEWEEEDYGTCLCEFGPSPLCNAAVKALGGGQYQLKCIFSCDVGQCSGVKNTDVPAEFLVLFYDEKYVCWCH